MSLLSTTQNIVYMAADYIPASDLWGGARTVDDKDLAVSSDWVTQNKTNKIDKLYTSYVNTS